jgi:hypothetical protein
MHASVGGEVQPNPVSSVLTTQLSANAQDAGGQDLGDLVEALGGGHQVGAASVAARAEGGWLRGPVHVTTNAPSFIRKWSDLRMMFSNG